MARLEKGRWRIQIMRNGRRLSQVLPNGTPKKVADDIERRMKLGYIDPAAVKKSCPTFTDFANDWLNEVSAVEHSASHLKKNRPLVRDHLVTMIGRIPLNEVTAQHIVELQRFLMTEGYANQSIAIVIFWGTGRSRPRRFTCTSSQRRRQARPTASSATRRFSRFRRAL